MKKLILMTYVLLAAAMSIHAQEIFDAVRNGDLAKVKGLVERDPQLVKARNANQSTPLHVAINVNNESIAGYLIEKGAEVNAVNVIGWTPLFYAQNIKIARMLVEKGADINFNRDGASYSDALRVALVDRRKDVAEYLIEKGAALPEIGSVWGTDLLIQALKSGSIKYLEKYEQRGFDPLYESEARSTLLHYASESDSTELIDHLIRRGVPFDKKNIFGLAPLHIAAMNGNNRVVKFFAQKGLDINARTDDGRSAYNLACEAQKNEIAEYLKSVGADQGPQRFPVLTGEYMGQPKPGKRATPFAPAIIEYHTPFHSAMVLTSDGNEIFWSKFTGIYSSKRIDGRWAKPEKIMDGDVPFISPDGKRLYFIAFKKTDGETNPVICVREKMGQGWTEPKELPDIINSIPNIHWQVSVDRKGNLYFGAEGIVNIQIYCSEFINGEYRKPYIIGKLKDVYAHSPYVAPDGSYLIISDQAPSPHLAILFRKKDGTWTERINLDRYIGNGGICPSVTHDGRYLFFLGSLDAKALPFWADASFINDLRKETLKDDK